MKINRRSALKLGVLASGAAAVSPRLTAASAERSVAMSQLHEAMARPVLKREFFPSPIIIESMDLLRYERQYMVRVRSADGAEGYGVGNNLRMHALHPIAVQLVHPHFLKQDARDLDQLVDAVFKANYKLQGLALWIPLAGAELAVLDMLGRISGRSMTELIGTRHHRRLGIYQANNFRGRTAGESIKRIEENVRRSEARALKIKVGGRMSHNADDPPGRTEALIPLVRETFGDDMTLYADSNGSYDAPKAIEVGRLLERYNYAFFEEPCPFDWLDDTRQVAEALTIPIAGGEQETSLWRFKWMIANNCLQVVQPDLFYFGGMIRSMRVARMAEAAGLPVVPHISGAGLGYIYNLLFVAALPNAGAHHEFKGLNPRIPVECDTSSLKSSRGTIDVPTGPGSGVVLDPDFINKHEVVTG